MSTVIPIKINASGELSLERCRCSTTVLEPSTAMPVPFPEPGSVAAEGSKGSYGQILKSSALIGGSQAANIAIGIVRTKAMAMLLGPAGFGLFGLYGSIQNLTQSIAGMGINSSGVRQIAEAAGSGDRNRIARTAAILRRTAMAVGLLGAVLLLALSKPVSQLTFGSTQRAASVALLSFAVLFTLVAGGQMALIQGVRRIGDLARIQVLGALFGLFTSIPLVYLLGEKGVVPSMISVAAMTILTSWWFSRKIQVQALRVTFAEIWHEASALVKLGSAFMASGLMTMGVAYFVRVILLRKVGFEATGLYQSAWTLGGLYVSFILQAMGADFYPRLTASIHRHADANRLVNEQTLIGLLLAAPGVIATLTFAPVIVSVLYSAKFAAAVTVLRWICLGVMLQVVTWPMGYIIVAKGRPAIFFAAELGWTLIAILLSWLCVTRFGLNGAGFAFFGSYVFHCALLYPMVRWLSGFKWSRENRNKGAAFFAAIGIVFAGFETMPFWLAETIGVLFAIATGIYSIRVLLRLVSSDRLPPAIRRILRSLGLIASESTELKLI